ncbi:MAG: hypothetical protein ABI477_24035 [Chryseolinea sp.]
MRILLVFLLSPLFTSGQKLHLEVVNPLIRVGDDIKVEIYDDALINPSASSQISISGTILIKNFASQADTKTIGSMNLIIDGVSYEAQALTITTLPAISLDTIQGIWITRLRSNGKNHLIVEQRVRNQIDIKVNSNRSEIKSERKTLYAQLLEDRMNFLGMSIISSHSDSGSKFVTYHNVRASFSYLNTIYIYEENANYKGSFVVSAREFERLPELTPLIFRWLE